MHVQRISKSGGLPLPLEDVQLDLRVDDTADAPTLKRLIMGAAGFLERRSGFVIIPGTFEAILCGGWPIDAFEIMRGPLRGVTAIQYLSDNAVWSDATLTDFQISALEKSFVVSPLSTFVAPDIFSDLDSVKVVFEAGFRSDTSGADEAPEMPDELKTTLVMLVGHYYQNRELFAADKIAEVELGAGALLASVRQYW